MAPTKHHNVLWLTHNQTELNWTKPNQNSKISSQTKRKDSIAIQCLDALFISMTWTMWYHFDDVLRLKYLYKFSIRSRNCPQLNEIIRSWNQAFIYSTIYTSNNNVWMEWRNWCILLFRQILIDNGIGYTFSIHVCFKLQYQNVYWMLFWEMNSLQMNYQTVFGI